MFESTIQDYVYDVFVCKCQYVFRDSIPYFNLEVNLSLPYILDSVAMRLQMFLESNELSAFEVYIIIKISYLV